VVAPLVNLFTWLHGRAYSYRSKTFRTSLIPTGEHVPDFEQIWVDFAMACLCCLMEEQGLRINTSRPSSTLYHPRRVPCVLSHTRASSLRLSLGFCILGRAAEAAVGALIVGILHARLG
jgi:hypothetical protein